MANSRFYSSIAQQTTLTATAVPADTTIQVAATTGFPTTPFTLALDYGAANEELVQVSNVSGLTLTVTRSIDGTSAGTHNSGAVVRHVSSARDFTDSRTHEASSSGVHGATGAVVGTTDTQTLTNKTVTRVLGSAQNFTMYNTGATGITQVIGDSTNPNASRLEIKDNEVNLNTLIFFTAAGNIFNVKKSGDTDTTYKLRLTDNDAATDRFAVLAGGTVAITPTSTTSAVSLDIASPDTSSTKKVIRVAQPGGANERFTLWNDGRVLIAGLAGGQTSLTVKTPTSPTVDTFRVTDNAGNTWAAVQNNGKLLANVGATIAQPGVTTGAVLQVGGSNVGYTGNLTQWVGPANTIVASIDQAGNASVNNLSAITFTQTTDTLTNVATAATNFSVVNGTRAMRVAGWIIVTGSLNRTTSTLSFDSAGNVADTDLCTIASNYRPDGFFGSDRIIASFSTGVLGGSVGMNPSTGVVQILDGLPNGTININDTVRFTFVYPI